MVWWLVRYNTKSVVHLFSERVVENAVSSRHNSESRTPTNDFQKDMIVRNTKSRIVLLQLYGKKPCLGTFFDDFDETRRSLVAHDVKEIRPMPRFMAHGLMLLQKRVPLRGSQFFRALRPHRGRLHPNLPEPMSCAISVLPMDPSATSPLER